jgi:Flp pilus assembly protein TadG
MRGILRSGAAVLRDNSGYILPMAVFGMFALAAMVGGGVDMSRTYMSKTRLQSACDAGTLAGRRAITNAGYNTAAQAQANSFFNANFNAGEQNATGVTFITSTPDSGSTVNGSASASVKTIIMSMFGVEQMAVAVTCKASMQVGNSDIVMVLDNTGSMDDAPNGSSNPPSGGSKIEILRAAMKSFYDTVATATTASNARIRYGFVPYSSAVNVGALLYNLNPNYIADSVTIQSRSANWVTTTTNVTSGWHEPTTISADTTANSSTGSWSSLNGTIYTGSSTCNAALPGSTAWGNNGSSTEDVGTPYVDGSGNQITITTTTQPQSRLEYQCVRVTSGQAPRRIQVRTAYRDLITTDTDTQTPIYQQASVQSFSSWTYQPVAFDTTTYKTFAATSTPTGNNGAAQTSTWAGCIEERQTVQTGSISYSTASGMSPSAAHDLNIDMAPTSDAATKWKPYWPELSYLRREAYFSSGSTKYRDADIASSPFGAKVTTYCPRASRLLSTMSESSFDAYADSMQAIGNTYHDIGMIWGARLSSPTGIYSSNVLTAPSNGGAVARHIIYMTDGELYTVSKLHSSYGVEFHDKRVTSNGSTDQNARHRLRFLAICEAAKAKGIRIWVIAFGTSLTADLQTCGSASSSYQANDSSQLNAAFQDIANQVGELRIVQ